jgi:hypothetical protein
VTSPKQVSFDEYLDIIFSSSNWLDACVPMLAVFLEDIESCRDNLDEKLPEIAPSILDQVGAIAGRAQRLELELRSKAGSHGPAFQTSELGAVLWWAGMALHKGMGAAEGARDKMDRKVWEDAFLEVHASMYETMSALSLLSVAEGMMLRMETEGTDRPRPN